MTIKVKKICLKCKTFDKSQNAHYKCAVKGSCPGLSWSGKKRFNHIKTHTNSDTATMKRLNSTETSEYNLEVMQCTCGFHIGLDATYLDQVGDFNFRCPSCHEKISTKKVFKV